MKLYVSALVIEILVVCTIFFVLKFVYADQPSYVPRVVKETIILVTVRRFTEFFVNRINAFDESVEVLCNILHTDYF